MKNELVKQNDELKDQNKCLRSLKDETAKNSNLNNGFFVNAVLNIPKKQENIRLIVKPKEKF